MMGADHFRTLHISLHHLGKLLISLIFSAHKAPLSLLPSRDIFSCIKVWISMPSEKKSCFLTFQNRGRLTSHLQSLTNIFSQSPAHSPNRKMWFRHNRLSAAKPISQQSCLFSVFLFFFNRLTFLPRKEEETYTAGDCAKKFYSFLASFKEKNKGM